MLNVIVNFDADKNVKVIHASNLNNIHCFMSINLSAKTKL